MPALWPALTVLQPFATALVLGFKPDENREWPPSPVALKPSQWLAIHAGKRLYPWSSRSSERYYQDLWLDAQRRADPPATRPIFHQLPRSAIVGAVRLVGTRTPEQAANPWATGPVCWHFDAAFVLREPVEAKGRLGIWKLDDPKAIDALNAGLEVWTATRPAA